MTASNAPRRGHSVAELLYTAIALFRATLLKCLPFAMVAVLSAEAPNFYWLTTGHRLEKGLPSDPTYWWLAFIFSAVALYIFSAMMLRQVYFSGGFAVNARQEFALAARRLPTLLSAWLLMQVSLFVGLVALVVPAVFLFICYLVLLPVILLEGQLNPVLALQRCVMLVWPNWWRICAAFVIALITMFVCVLVVAALLEILANLLAGGGSTFQAIFAAGSIAIGAAVFVFFSALALAIHSSANSSA
ncbi:MAG TPA: hypothetical protein VNZ06_08330 [Steroidobacteraceae bacterium]|jgi:hypothetical protein|nr:hypothetical protein [Steroidobacteraceae bacterium]